jgi:hypothetical protein
MSRSKNQGRYVQLEDGRTGILFHKDCTLINGKFPVYIVSEKPPPNLFDFGPTLNDWKKETAKKVLCDPKKMKVIGYFD